MGKSNQCPDPGLVLTSLTGPVLAPPTSLDPDDLTVPVP